MAVLINAKLKLNKLNKDKIFKGKVHNFYDVTISLNDESKFDRNVSIWTRQTKEERDSKESKEYIGEGEVIWMDDNGAVLVQKEGEATQTEPEPTNDFPF